MVRSVVRAWFANGSHRPSALLSARPPPRSRISAATGEHGVGGVEPVRPLYPLGRPPGRLAQDVVVAFGYQRIMMERGSPPHGMVGVQLSPNSNWEFALRDQFCARLCKCPIEYARLANTARLSASF